MLFSYIVGHVPVNFRKKIFINEKVLKKTQNIRFFTHSLVTSLNNQGRTHICGHYDEI